MPEAAFSLGQPTNESQTQKNGFFAPPRAEAEALGALDGGDVDDFRKSRRDTSGKGKGEGARPACA